MTFYIIIRGPLGVGKSTISKSIAKELNAEYISIDKVLSENGLDKVENDIPEKNFIKANEIILPKAQEILSRGKPIVFDGNFYFHAQISHLIENLEGQHYIFTLDASIGTCIRRDAQREKPCGEDAAKAVYSLASRVIYGQKISTENKSIEQVIEEIKKQL
ncbi:AAA family ATPase [Candidatus Woesearchaeota archaeon]|nr:AAA family ATPase [Candidatus Woesearchaeota archaeon]